MREVIYKNGLIKRFFEIFMLVISSFGLVIYYLKLRYHKAQLSIYLLYFESFLTQSLSALKW